MSKLTPEERKEKTAETRAWNRMIYKVKKKGALISNTVIKK